ncbi:hypothetical protein NL108_014390 [Boleophthalmus pectinirostris]|nr:hypothetical protein NL108_014390 [Boleophthalmus pectinirostris]
MKILLLCLECSTVELKPIFLNYRQHYRSDLWRGDAIHRENYCILLAAKTPVMNKCYIDVFKVTPRNIPDKAITSPRRQAGDGPSTRKVAQYTFKTTRSFGLKLEIHS